MSDERALSTAGLTRGRRFSLSIVAAALLILFVATAPTATAQDLGLGDVLDGIKTAEGLRDFMKDPGGFTKGKLKGAAANRIKDAAFGPSLTGQMQQVLFEVYRAFDALPRRGGVCPGAAQDHAWSVLFDLYTTGITGAFGRIGADIILTIPSVPGMAANLAKEAGKMAREEAEKYLREHLAPTPPETYSVTSSKGPCTYAIVALIDYSAGRYEAVIVSDCKCQPLATRGRSAAVAGWAIRASGRATPTLDGAFIKARIGRARVTFSPDCNCSGEGGGLHLTDSGGGSGLQEAPEDDADADACDGIDCTAVMQGIAETERNLEKAREALGVIPEEGANDASEDARDHLEDVVSRLTSEIQARLQEYAECCNNTDPSFLSQDLQHFFRLAVSRFQGGTYYPPKNESEEESEGEGEDQGSRLESPAGTREGEYVRGEPTSPPAGSQVLTAGVAFAGGSIVGMVLSPQDTAIAGAAVEVGSIGGVVTTTETKEDGSFTAKVPAGAAEALRVAVAGIGEAISMKIVSTIPASVAATPPSFVMPGSVVDVIGDYPSVELQQPNLPSQPNAPAQTAHPSGTSQPSEPVAGSESPAGRVRQVEPGRAVGQVESRVPVEPGEALERYGSTALPTARSLGPGGAPAVTRYRIPQALPPGPLKTVLTDSSGAVLRVDTGIFQIVSASIDQSKLTSGQNAEFRYRFDFGPGPARRHWITVMTSGPIRYRSAGRRQPLEVDEEGHAEFTGKVKATKGTPGGKAFNISIRIER